MISRRFPKRRGEPRSVAGIVLLERLYRPRFEPLEDRVMLDAGGGSSGQLPPAIVVGRMLSSYFVGAIQDNQETITYTVYNEQANPETGVLLTTTLEPGVTFANASQQPDQSGQDLAWSLGTINGFGRASLTLTVSLANPIPTQLDSGAHGYATLDAGAVSNTTPAATLRPGTVDPSLLASTPDANTTDPFLQEEAAALNYDPQRIFDFLHNQIGYNSYPGSVRGARGTLWSNAGNALDVASLGVALMRASGIPAQYVQGTLSQTTAQSLILSMFPASDQVVGAIPSGETPAAPQDSATLLAETESHDWFQFDAGSGMTDADPLIPGATVGQTFTTASGKFAEVPDSLRATTEIKLNAEIYSTAGALFGEGPSTTTVLDQTFNDVDLVGYPIMVGNFVQSAAAGGLVFTSVTNTFSPYLEVGDEANADPSRDEVLHGTPYQEVLTNFPFGSQILTGLFMDVTLSGPQAAPATFEKTLVDRIGFAARQGTGTVVLPPISPTAQPILTNNDLWTLNALPGLQSPDVLVPLRDALVTYQDQLNAIMPTISTIPANGPQTPEQTAALTETGSLNRTIALLGNEIVAIAFARASDKATAQIEPGYGTLSYVTSPRLLVASTHQDGANLSVALDLLKDDARDIEDPGQAVGTSFVFEQLRGYLDSDLEGQIITAATGQQAISFTTVFNELANEGGHLVMITQDNLNDLNGLALSPDAKARITQEVTSGLGVLTPSQMVTINGQATVEWLQFNLSTGQIISVAPDGGHQAIVEYAAELNSPLNLVSVAFIGTVQGFGFTNLKFLGIFLGEINTGKDFKQVIRDALSELILGLAKDYAGLAIGVIPTEGLGQEVLKSILGIGAGAGITGKPPSPLEIGQAVIKLLIPKAYGTLVTAYEAGSSRARRRGSPISRTIS